MNSRMPLKVENLAIRLENTDSIDHVTLRITVKDINITASDIEEYASFDHPDDQSYGRKLLYESRRIKIFLMSWSPGDFTAIHDHGSTEWGCVVALGDFTHRVYRFEDGLLRLKNNSLFGEGQVACLSGDLIHMMGNAGNRNITSLHIYGSDSQNKYLARRSNLYFPDSKSIITTNGPAFLNCHEDTILKSAHFDRFDENVKIDYLDVIRFRSRKRQPERIPDSVMFNKGGAAGMFNKYSELSN